MGEIEMHASGSHTRFDELDPVLERIRDVHALQAGDRHVPLDGMTGIDAADDECREAFHAERRVGLAGGLEIRVDPEMELGCTAAEPETAAVGERGGLGPTMYMARGSPAAVPAGRVGKVGSGAAPR
jgi:hypothetical protein